MERMGADVMESRSERNIHVPVKDWAFLATWGWFIAYAVADGLGCPAVIRWPLVALSVANNVRYILAINRDWRHWLAHWRAMGMTLDD